MSSISNVPGVYREEVLLRPAAKLTTGIAGFVGFAAPTVAETVVSVVALTRRDEFTARVNGAADSYLADAVAGFFQNGGLRCYVATASVKPTISDAQKPEAQKEALVEALNALAAVSDIDLIAIPDAMRLYSPGMRYQGSMLEQVQVAVLHHCEIHVGRMAILDAVPAATNAVLEQRRQIAVRTGEPVNGTLYYPWIKTCEGRLVPPCGHVAGIYARSDARAGIFKAPANEEIRGALDLCLMGVSDNGVVPDQEALNPEGVNCLRTFPGRGIRVWGARTLSRDPNWRYINVRRLFLTLQRWVDLNMGWVSFEPNTPVLWIRITREIAAYLTGLWAAGGLAGATAEQAFFVKCDGETNPQEARQAGQVITEIGLAPARPAEFICVRVIHHTGVEPQ